MPNVTGSKSATPIAADNPGKQPIVIPKAVDTSIAMRLRGVRACRNPAAIKPNVSMRDLR